MTSPAMAGPAVAALLSEIVDDAGLFPPASLPMDEAVRAHMAARQGQYRWMLGRFLCPSDRLEELETVVDRDGPPFRLGVVIAANGWVDELGAGTASSSHVGNIEAVEARLPDDAVGL